jgi:hypothetical protein
LRRPYQFWVKLIGLAEPWLAAFAPTMAAKAQMSARLTPIVLFSNFATTGASAAMGGARPLLLESAKSMQPTRVAKFS